ncbi:MAG: diaminopimelate epimerase [Firmicutes bacterium]|nr:diaminopimelate epimerase [Bacillota bacterium]
MRFIKMHGLGNDYVYVDAIAGGKGPAAEPELAGWPDERLRRLAVAVSDRHLGVGGDGLILMLRGEQAPFRMRIFNADGSEGEMCGNGIRCVAKYLVDEGYADGGELPIETRAGLIRTEVLGGDRRIRQVRVDMGPPRSVGDPLELEAAGGRWRCRPVSMGNPHAVVFVDDPGAVDLAVVGPALEHHRAFPGRTNVEFVRVAAPDRLEVRVWERGSGATLACGTGACASAVAAAVEGRAGRRLAVDLPGGRLEVEWAADGRVWMTGPAEEVFRGEYPIPF